MGSRGMGWGPKYRSGWGLDAAGTVGSWLAAFGSALGWRLGAVGTLDAAAWVGGLAQSRHWLCPASPGSLLWVTSLASSPPLDVLGAGELPPGRLLCLVLLWEPALCPPAHAGTSRRVLWGARFLHPCLSPLGSVSLVGVLGVPGHCGSCHICSAHPLVGGSFLRGPWVEGHWGGGLRQTHALACLCSTGPGDSPCPDLQPTDPAAFLFAFPGAEGSAGVARPPSHCCHAVAIPMPGNCPHSP